MDGYDRFLLRNHGGASEYVDARPITINLDPCSLA
jgi:hypothetical protein